MRNRPRINKAALRFGMEGVTKAPDYLDWLRGLACAVCYALPVEPAHLRLRAGPGTGAGLAQKNDRYVLPLCRECHARQHRVGERVFWKGLDPHQKANRFWQEWPGRQAYEESGNG